MQANEKKRPKEEKDITHRLRPFARLQTAEDYESFVADTLCKHSHALKRVSNTDCSTQGRPCFGNESKNYNTIGEWA